MRVLPWVQVLRPSSAEEPRDVEKWGNLALKGRSLHCQEGVCATQPCRLVLAHVTAEKGRNMPSTPAGRVGHLADLTHLQAWRPCAMRAPSRQLWFLWVKDSPLLQKVFLSDIAPGFFFFFFKLLDSKNCHAELSPGRQPDAFSFFKVLGELELLSLSWILSKGL